MTPKDPPKISVRQDARIEVERAEWQFYRMEQRLDRAKRRVRETRKQVEEAKAAPDYETSTDGMINQFEQPDHWHCLVTLNDTGRVGSLFVCGVHHKTKVTAGRHWRSRTMERRRQYEPCEEIPVWAVSARCQRERAIHRGSVI